jgi:hypothetical protein
MVTEIQLFGSTDLTPSDSCLWGRMKSEVYTRKADARDELLARILDVAVRIKTREDQLRRTPRDLRTRVAKCTGVGGGIFEYLLCTVTNLSFVCNKFVI